MTLDRIKGQLVFECNGCGETFSADPSDFPSAMQEFREQGWRAVQISRVWHHFCPACLKLKGWD